MTGASPLAQSRVNSLPVDGACVGCWKDLSQRPTRAIPDSPEIYSGCEGRLTLSQIGMSPLIISEVAPHPGGDLRIGEFGFGVDFLQLKAELFDPIWQPRPPLVTRLLTKQNLVSQIDIVLNQPSSKP